MQHTARQASGRRGTLVCLQGLFVANRDEQSGHSSTQVRRSLAEGNRAYLERAVPRAVLRNLYLVLGLEKVLREASKHGLQGTKVASGVATLLQIGSAP